MQAVVPVTGFLKLAGICEVGCNWPVVTIFCDPKSGDIFVPAMAALAFISAFTIAPSTIFALVTLLSAGSLTPRLLNVRIKKSAPVSGGLLNIISLPSTLNPSLGVPVPSTGFELHHLHLLIVN